MKKKFFLGIDGGGTKTDLLLGDESGNIILSLKEGGTNYQVVGINNTFKTLKKLLQTVVNKCNIKLDALEAVIGLAGVDMKEDEIMLSNIIRKIGLKKFLLLNDAFVALKAGLLEKKYGIVVIAGTGTITVGRSKLGWKRLGGYTSLLGDSFSGPDIGFRAISTVFRKWELGNLKSVKILADELIRYFNKKNIIELHRYLYFNPPSEQELGYVLKPLLTAYKKGDKIAKKILNDAAVIYSENIKSIAKKLKMKGKIKVVLGGGVFTHSQGILDMLVKKKLPKRFECIVLKYPPVFGALLMAYEESGMLNSKILNNLLLSIDNVKQS